MADETDPLNRDTHVAGELTETGLKASTNSRLLAAIDHLAGNAVDLLNLPLERRARLHRAKTDGEVRVIQALARSAAEQVQCDPQFAQLALEQHLDAIVRKQQNKEAVLIEAHEILKSETPSADTGDAEDQPLDEDWLNYFASYAEKATSENMRALWGRILSGEIRQPGAFSLTTLRIVSELSRETATTFQNLATVRIGSAALLNPSGKTPRDMIHDVLDLQAAGLLKGSGGDGQWSQRVPVEDGVATMKFWDKLLYVEVADKGITQLDIPVLALLTKAGSELVSFLPLDVDATFEYLAEIIGSRASKISVHHVLHEAVGGELSLSATPIAVLRDAPPKR